MKYKRVTVGGTFDHFHLGHKKLLDTAFEAGEAVWVGVTSEAYISTVDPKTAKNSALIESYTTRRESVEDYLREKGLSGRAKVMSIDDRFGTTLTDETLEAIIVSPETELVATEINLLRAQKNWPALEVIVVPWVLARDGAPIHSERIRKGEIDRAGNVWELPKDWGVRKLPTSLRRELKKPFGELLVDSSKNHEDAIKKFVNKFLRVQSSQPKVDHPLDEKFKVQSLITVGDAVTDALVKEGVTPDVSIVDLKIQRKPVYKTIEELGLRNIKVIKKVKSPAGTVSFTDFSILRSLIRNEAKPNVLQIEGEDDLFTLLALLLAPLGSLIVYGQPNEGIVVIEVNEEHKHIAQAYLEKFK